MIIDKRQKSEVRRQKSEDRSQKTEVRSQKTEVREQMTDARGWQAFKSFISGMGYVLFPVLLLSVGRGRGKQ